MDKALRRNGINLCYDTEKIGQVVIKDAQGLVDEAEFARHLRFFSQSTFG